MPAQRFEEEQVEEERLKKKYLKKQQLKKQQQPEEICVSVPLCHCAIVPFISEKREIKTIKSTPLTSNDSMMERWCFPPISTMFNGSI